MKEQSPVDKYYCDCPGPLPIILDCVVRERHVTEEGATSAYEHDCTLNWKPEPALSPQSPP